MLREILSTGVAVMISGSMTPATTARGHGAQTVSESRGADEVLLKTFFLVEGVEDDGTLRCPSGFEAPEGGVFVGPVLN